MRQFVEHQQFRAARQRRVEVEFDDAIAIFAGRRHDFEPFNQSAGLGATMRLDEAHHVDAAALTRRAFCNME